MPEVKTWFFIEGPGGHPILSARRDCLGLIKDANQSFDKLSSERLVRCISAESLRQSI